MNTQPFEASTVKSYHLIFNPKSGPGDPGSKLVAIESALESLPNLTVRTTKPDVEVTALAEQAIADGADVIIAAGGDGTVSGVASALVDTDIVLGIIPTGTANAFATALGIPENFAGACEIIKTGRYQQLDTARCNDRMMLLATSIGFEADLLKRMDREEKSQWGKLAIVVNSLRELREFEQFQVRLETPEQTWDEAATAVTIANTATVSMVLAQGPGKIAADNGILSITLVTPEHQWGVLKSAADLFLSALQQQTLQSETVRSCQATQVTVSTDPPQAVFVDGEPTGKTPVTIKCHPRSLTVLTPS
jgi:YegS/Rv2252/BmrU family lipid kinase